MKGYMGRLLCVDLSGGKIREEPMDPRWAEGYIGGTGLGVRLAYDEIPPGADPLGPENKLYFMTGPLTATTFPTAGRYQLVFKSPLTGILCDSSSGGFWGAELKQAGYDGLVVEGTSPEPVYLWIKDGHTELRDATHLWGMDALDVQAPLKEEVADKRARIVAIGPAGEKGALISCVINDDGRAPGRGGNGAVMGSKKLKAIVVRGTGKVAVADQSSIDELNRRIKEGTQPIDSGWADLSPYGTAQVLDNDWVIGDIPVKNWQVGQWEEGSLRIGGKRMAETILTRTPGCYRCPIRCARWVRIEEGPYRMDGPGAEYETLASFGTMTLTDDLEAISYANDLCNRYGLDTISTGTTIAFAMEAYEKGILTRDDTGGIDLIWGNAQALVQVTELIGKREGVGQLLSQGMRRTAQQLGHGAQEFACHVKGLETPMHDPRTYFSLAATYAAGPRGACHLHGASMLYEDEDAMPEWGLTKASGRHNNEGKGVVAKVAMDHAAVMNSMVVCMFMPFYYSIEQPSDLAFYLEAVTGYPHTAQSLRQVGDRITTLHRAYNNRCGVTAADDTLSPRQLQPTKESENAGYVPDVDYVLKEFYQASGWTEEGKPSREKLLELGLDEVVADLYD